MVNCKKVSGYYLVITILYLISGKLGFCVKGRKFLSVLAPIFVLMYYNFDVLLDDLCACYGTRKY